MTSFTAAAPPPPDLRHVKCGWLTPRQALSINSDAATLARFVKGLPKAELHIHIEGSFEPETMLRIASMNLLLHGIKSPGVHYQDTLGSSFPEKHPQLSANSFDLILANPPFAGAIDHDRVDSSLKSKVKTKKTELLFMLLFLRLLKDGGRCAAIVPDGVLFGSSKAHVGVRQILLHLGDLGLQHRAWPVRDHAQHEGSGRSAPCRHSGLAPSSPGKSNMRNSCAVT